MSDEETEVGLSEDEFQSLKEETAKVFRRWMDDQGRIQIEDEEEAELFIKEVNSIPDAAAVDEDKISFEDQMKLKDEFGIVWNDLDIDSTEEEE